MTLKDFFELKKGKEFDEHLIMIDDNKIKVSFKSNGEVNEIYRFYDCYDDEFEEFFEEINDTISTIFWKEISTIEIIYTNEDEGEFDFNCYYFLISFHY